jgi:hypothetical protein
MKEKKYPKPKKIMDIPMVIISGEVWGFEVSELSQEEQNDLKKHELKK